MIDELKEPSLVGEQMEEEQYQEVNRDFACRILFAVHPLKSQASGYAPYCRAQAAIFDRSR